MLLQILPTASCLYIEIINMGQLFTFLEQISISLFMELNMHVLVLTTTETAVLSI